MSDADPIATAAAELLSPLTAGLAGPGELATLLGALGVDVELDGESAAAVADVLALGEAVADLEEALERLVDGSAAAAVDVIAAAARIWEGVGDLASLDANDVADLPAPLDDPATWTALLARLPDQLVATWLRERIPVLQTALEAVGVFERDPDGASATVPAYRADWSALPQLVGDPTGAAAARLGWDAAFDAPAAMALIAQAAGGLATARWVPPPPEVVDLLYGGVRPAPEDARSLRLSFGTRTASDGRGRGELALVVSPVPGVAPTRHEGLHLGVDGWGSTSGLALGSGWSLAADGLPVVEGVVGARLTPAGVELDPAAGDGAPALSLVAAPPEPWRLLGAADGTRIELGGASFGLELAGDEVLLSIQLDGLLLVIDPGALGGLLKAVVPNGLEVAADVGVTVSSRDGVRLNGLPGLTIPIADRLALGPVTLRDVVLELAPGEDGLEVKALTGVDFALGPVSATAEGAGLRTTISVPGGTGGNLGPLDIALAPTVPNLVGLSLDAGVVKAAGVLFYDPPADTYGGVISVEAAAIGISAVGIVTAPPTGAWSLFFALFLDLPSIQLGFGFTLTGVGGLAGINRTLDAEALGAGVRSGSLDAVLFPADPVAEAPVIIEQLQAIFPPSEGRYVFGPVVKIGWGTPTLIEAQLGLVIALPDPIMFAVLGTVTSVLPTEDVELVALHLDVGGVVDFAAGTLAIDASLHDSHVIGFALSGDMALRASFAGAPDFLMAIGGFHPGFKDAPAGFPALRRLSLGLSAAPVLYVNFECYFAVTSNSVQFGASFELRASIAGFGIDGGTEFDALVEFSPFLVSTRVAFHVAITAAGFDLAGVWLEASVDGPNPWHVVGTARFKILGIDESVRVDERIGAGVAEPAVEEADLLTLLETALTAEDAWAAVATASPGVQLSAAPAVAGELVAMPDGRVAVSQNVVPLGLTLDKAGDAPLGDYDLFHVEPAGGSLASTGTLEDWFAPGYFFELAAGEQLSSPSFELLESGIEFGSGRVSAGPDVAATLEYEQILRDPELGEDRVELDPTELDGALLAVTGAVRGLSGFGIAASERPVSLAPARWDVTHRNTGLVETTAATWSAAHQSLAGRRTATTVVPGWESFGLPSEFPLDPIDWELDP